MTANRHSSIDVDPGLISDTAHTRMSPALLSVVTTLILSGVVFAAFPLRYETNDDVGMNLGVAGVAYVSEPGEHLVYTNVLLGYPLSRLYRLAPDVPWYGLYQLLAVVSSAAAINTLLLSINRSWKQWILMCLHFFAAIAPCLISIQFTKTAFLATEAGLLLLLAPCFREECWPRGWTIAGIALLLLGAAIRFDAFLLSLIAMAPIIAVAVWNGSSRPWKRVLTPLLMTLACCVLLQCADRAYYAASPAWRDFLEFNGYRHHIITRHGTLRYDEKTKPAFDAVGWSRNDYTMLATWFCSDRRIYSTAKLRQFAHEIAKVETTVNGPRQVAARVQPSAATVWLWLFIAANLLSLSTRTARLALVGSFAYSTLLALAISAWLQYLPDRALFSLFLPPACTAVLTARDGFAPLKNGFHGLRQFAGVAAALVAVAFAAHSWREQGRARLRLEDAAANVLRHLDPRPDLLVVNWGDAFKTEFLVSPLGSLDAIRPLRLLGLGWGLRSPASDRRMQEFGIDDLPLALLDRDDVMLVCDRWLLEWLALYMEEHEGALSVEVRTIVRDESGLCGDVVQLRRVEQRSIP